MNYKTGFYLALAWGLSVGLAYVIGWWNGMTKTANVATSAAGSTMPLVLTAMIVVGVLSAAGAFWARGYLSRGKQLSS